MNFKSLFVLVIASFLVLFSRVEAKLMTVPSNTRALVGDSVRLQCFTENKNYPPSWSHIKVGSTEPSDVYMTVKDGNDMIVGRMTEEYYVRFRVNEDRSTGEYSLDITGVQLGDAGRYMCIARGGLGQQATAELGVIAVYPECASNITEAIGEKICNHEPDRVGLSCSFRYNGNGRPRVTWVKTDQPGRVVITEEAQWTDDRGMAVSNFVIRADTEGLNGSSYTCIISSSNDANDNRISCTTPVINVLKLANAIESRTLVHLEEVQCTPSPQLTKTGCKWVKRKLEEDSKGTVVAEGSLLNLYRPEFDSGIYVCIVEYNIRGQPCPVETLTITFNRPEPSLSDPPASSSTSKLVIILTVVLSVAVTVIVTVPLIVFYRKRASGASTPSSEGSIILREQNKRNVGTSNEERRASDSEKDSLTGGDGGSSSSSGTSNKERPDSTEGDSLKGRDVAVDIPDSRRAAGTLGDRELRNRRIEEEAVARMRRNALRQGTDNAGFSSPTDGDVAEGIGRSAEASKDE